MSPVDTAEHPGVRQFAAVRGQQWVVSDIETAETGTLLGSP
jgi:hypothetical protein